MCPSQTHGIYIVIYELKPASKQNLISHCNSSLWYLKNKVLNVNIKVFIGQRAYLEDCSEFLPVFLFEETK